MQSLRPARLVLAGVLLLSGACGLAVPGASSKNSPTDSAGGAAASPASCAQDTDCPTGLVCQAQVCVASDGLPPETKDNQVFQQPETSAHYVFALSPSQSSVAVIDPTTLAIRSIVLPADPAQLQVIPGQDSVVIVSTAGTSVSYLTCDAATCALQTQATDRGYAGVVVSADGQWALLWTPDSAAPATGEQGIVGLVDLAALAAGTPVPIVDRAAGQRLTNAFFRMASGKAVDAVVVAESEIAVIDLGSLATDPLPQYVMLPSDYTDVDTREAVQPPTGAWVLLGSLTSLNIGVLDVAARQLTLLAQPGFPSDLELSTDGQTAVAVLRSTGQVVWFPLPAALTDPTQIMTAMAALPGASCATGMTACTVSAGQAVLSHDGQLAALFTNASPTMSFAMLDLKAGTITNFTGLAKLVDTLGIGPDNQTVLVVHTPDPGSTASDPTAKATAQSQGYSVVNLPADMAQLVLTSQVPTQSFIFSNDALHAAVTLRDDTDGIYGIDAIDLQDLVVESLSLASAPEFAGPFAGDTPEVWVTQDFAAGRISFVNLATIAVSTATGYALNAGIGP